MSRMLAVTTLLVWALACSTAAASTVRLTSELVSVPRDDPYPAYTVTITAAPGERNEIVVSSAGRDVLVRDAAGATGAGCTQEDAQTVRCRMDDIPYVSASLGDGDDTISLAPDTAVQGLSADGGAGNDVISGRAGVQRGGPGDDRLTGGTVQGGPGDDVLAGLAVDYRDHAEGVTFDFAGGTAGAPGENDQVAPGTEVLYGGEGPDVVRAAGTAIEVYGGAGDDVVDGSPATDRVNPGPGDDTVRGHGGDDRLGYGLDTTGDDRLEGGPGEDFLEGGDGADALDGGSGEDGLDGGPGADVLDGGAGTDALDGGPGTDRLLARDGGRDVATCAADVLEGDQAEVDGADVTLRCDRIDRAGARRLELHGFAVVGRRDLRLVLSCPAAAARACRAVARIRGTKGYERTRAVRIAPGRRARIAVRPRASANASYTVRVELPSGRTLRTRRLPASAR